MTTPREIADRYVHELADLDPMVSTFLGLRELDGRPLDFSPAAAKASADLAKRTLAELDPVETPDLPAVERHCAAALRDRLQVEIADFEAGEHLRALRNIASPVHTARMILMMMPRETPAQWAAVGERLAGLTGTYASLTESLEEGRTAGLLVAPRQVSTVIEQLQEWTVTDDHGKTWFHTFVADGPSAAQPDLQAAADAAVAAVNDLRTYLADTYLPASADVPDAVGEERYRRAARREVGIDVDPQEAYAWGWQEYQRIDAEMRELAQRIQPGSTPLEAMRHLDQHGHRITGVEEVRQWLQDLMDTTIQDMHGTHFDIAEPVRTVEAMIAPPGSAAAPYYQMPSVDFSRPGRTWLPTLGREEFPVWDLVSTWYHEGVPGHHLQLAHWAYLGSDLSLYQTSLGFSSGPVEGWALYAERLMEELGKLDDETRMGYLNAQMMRAVRVVIDIGMHLELDVPADSPIGAGQRWTPELAEEFFRAHSGLSDDFIASEIVRYLGWPAQAISYKLGERAWLTGRENARRRAEQEGREFDLKAWHMAGLSLGGMSLDDLVVELSAL